MHSQKLTVADTIKSLGLVFGDIGTSPIYTLAVIFMLTERTETNFIGILSLIIWTLILLVTVQYAWLAMNLSKGGEGGTIVLLSILRPLLRSGKQASVAAVLAFAGVSLLVGDGVITPAITILSAVEGLVLIPGLEDTPGIVLVALASAITLLLFSVQRKGSGKLSAMFGPVMAIWFSAMAFSGFCALLGAPGVLRALSPHYGIGFIADNGLAGFLVLSEVILCSTGGEALYADMGHMGRKPILAAWCAVFLALLLSYAGQTAFLIANPDAKNVLFAMIYNQSPQLYIPFIILSLLATVIASQSLISGIFSVMHQCMATHIMPLFKIDYTSRELRSQIYIDSINWMLAAAVLLVIYGFRESHALAAAYGFAVTGTMTITAVLMAWVFRLRKNFPLMAVALILCLVDAAYLAANFHKLPHGGYWSVIIALVPFSVILIYTQGQKAIYRRMRPTAKSLFLARFAEQRAKGPSIEGTAIFFLRSLEKVSPYIVKTMFENGIIYELNVMLCIERTNEPLGVAWSFGEDPAEGIRIFTVSAGYMEVVDIDAILTEVDIAPRAIFYGVEEIVTSSPVWKLYALIKKLAPSFVQFYKMPLHAVHGVLSRITL